MTPTKNELTTITLGAPKSRLYDADRDAREAAMMANGKPVPNLIMHAHYQREMP